jgi:hypothetical protein
MRRRRGFQHPPQHVIPVLLLVHKFCHWVHPE